MKKYLIGLLFVSGMLSGQKAVNFNCNDCSGTSHDLFTELNSGKVIVLVWVMPCSACVAVATSAHNTVKTYSATNPGQVKFYLCDDYANTSCASLNSWANGLGLTDYTSFSNSSINMSDYGSTGMPKTIVISGGSCPKVYLNQNNGLNSLALSNAINKAIASSAGVTYSMQSRSAIEVVPMNTITTSEISQVNTGNKKISLKWELLASNFPGSWQATMTDFTTAYTNIPAGPNTMDSVPAGNNGYLRLNVDPGNVTGEGDLSAIVYKDGFKECADTVSWFINTGTVGIHKNSSKGNLRAFPNPVNDWLQLEYPNKGNATAVIADLHGKVVRQSVLTEGNNLVDFSSLPKGLYIISVTSQERNYSLLITKE